MTANIPNTTRKAVYRRDHFRCALCDSTDGIQIHHYVHRGCGGNDTLHNLITLCWRCHATAHDCDVYGSGWCADDVNEACADYLCELYGPEWWPYKRSSVLESYDEAQEGG